MLNKKYETLKQRYKGTYKKEKKPKGPPVFNYTSVNNINKYDIYKSNFAQKLCIFIAILIGVLASAGTGYLTIAYAKLFSVSCPYTNNRLCNNQGTCEAGVCHCRPAFSGVSCTETQIPGYDVKTNTQCNGHGGVFQEFINTPPECDQAIINGNRVGPGWNSLNCSLYVKYVQDALQKTLSPILVPELATIPICNCEAPWGGYDCNVKLCPTDSEGAICGDNGDPTVGYFNNFTEAGFGCQCLTPVVFFNPEYLSLLQPSTILSIEKNDNKLLKTVFCGTIYFSNGTFGSENIFNGTTVGTNSSLILISSQSNYKCYCKNQWAGFTCTEGRCPYNLQSNLICNGHGSPTKGQGYLTNTTKTTNNDLPCSINCQSGYKKCSNFKCVQTQTQGQQLFLDAPYCNNPYICPINTPVRCYDGRCVEIPGPGSHGCVNRYSYGSIDHGRLDVVKALYVCANITNLVTYSLCFANSTLPSNTQFIDTGGIIWYNNQTLEIDLGSPMVYYEFSTNSTGGVVISNWNGQVKSHTGPLVTGFLEYEETGNWLLISNTGSYRLLKTVDDYTLCPLPFNYTGGVNVPSNYTFLRISKSTTDVVYTLDVITSFVSLSAYRGQSYLLVQAPSIDGVQTWYHPLTGELASESQCLTNPSACSFIRTATAIRSLDFRFYVCKSGVLPILQTTPCSTPILTLIQDLSGYLFYWETCATVSSDLTFALDDSIFDTLERNFTRKSFPFNITFGYSPLGDYSTILDISLLTLQRVTIPCACGTSNFEANSSVLNNEWFNEPFLREPRADLINANDWVVFATYNTGERQLQRGQIISSNILSSVISIINPWTNKNYTIYAKDVRLITPSESLRGWYDGLLMLEPFRCPDGRLSNAESQTNVALATANCTYVIPTVECNIVDETWAAYGCTCNMVRNVCQCGSPATPSFELDLLERLKSLTTLGCQCILFTPDEADISNSSITISNVNAYAKNLLFNINQQVTNIMVKTTGVNCDQAVITLKISSDLFVNLTSNLDYRNATNSTLCESWLSLSSLWQPAYSNITVYSTHLISFITVLFATPGYSLTNFVTDPVYTASSNSNDAKNVNLLNSSYWVSSSSLHEIPVFIQVLFDRPVYIDYMTIAFYMAGKNNYPNRIYVQGFSNGSWYGLGSISTYVQEGGWETYTLPLDSEFSYIAFRLITQAGRFGIRQWFFYSNQKCECDDNTNMILRLTDTEGLKTITDLLNEIEFFNQNINPLLCEGVDDCIIKIGTDSFKQVANDGLCQDVFYVGSESGLPGILLLNETLVYDYFYLYTNLTIDIFPGINALQSSNTSGIFLSTSELITFYSFYTQGFYGTGNFSNSTTNDLSVLYYYTVNSSIIAFNQTELFLYTINPTNFAITLQTFIYEWGNLLRDEFACPVGNDLTDCGPQGRLLPYMPGITCSLTFAQSQLSLLIQNASILVNKTYYVSNFSELTNQWTALYYNIEINRTYVQLQLTDCPDQLCDISTPIRCNDGKCVKFESQCDVRYTCPGNGCVESSDASLEGNLVYACACALGYAGSGCEYGVCLPATPFLKNGVPAAEECRCGADAPLRLKQPVVDVFRKLDVPTLIRLNNRVTGNSAPKSPSQVAYLNIMPIFAPYGQILRIPRFLPHSNLISQAQSEFDSSCPFMRRGYYNEHKYFIDDIQYEDPVTGVITWRVYINPETGAEEIFPWSSPFAYDDFPFPCANGQCVASPSDCAVAEALYPSCSGRGTCMSDGSCQCFPGYKTFMISPKFSESIGIPYESKDGIPDPTAWKLNFNSIHYGLRQCNALDCEVVDCTAPTGCYPGNPDIDFADRQELCDRSTGREGKCALSQQDCIDGVNLFPLLRCSGNGIPRKKDFSDEEYCECGVPISSQVNVSQLSQITQLKKVGWGGPACNEYYAPLTTIFWSFWDFEVGQPYKSLITKEVLPGKWVSRNAIVGPDPDDKAVWDQCCQGVDRLEKCRFTPCRVEGQIKCELSYQCKDPLVYYCNNHGRPLASGLCECEINVEEGSGYTFDLAQFSDKGCYKRIQCPDCNFVPSCSEPKEWRHPLPYDIGFDQQWYSCIQGIGLYSNATLLNEISSSTNQFNEQLIQGLSQVAIKVIRAEQDLNSCICVYPNDTISSKCCMVTGSSFNYKQNYNTPYLLSGNVTNYPYLTDNTLESGGYESYTFTSGTTITFDLNNNASTTLSAVRIFGLKPVNTTTLVSFTSNGVTVCPTSTLIEQQQTSYLEWIAGSSALNTGAAFYCGPIYQCYNFRLYNNLEYQSNCALPTSTECRDWKNSICASSATNVIWPIDSDNLYQGCNRDADVLDPCTCCTLLIGGTAPVLNGKIDITIEIGSVQMGQIRFYGYTQNALTPPTGLTDTLQTQLGPTLQASSCQDRKFYRQYLPEDKDPYAPLQNITTYDGAFNTCNYTGGYLAVTQNIQDDADISILQRACASISQADNEKCWISARDIKNNDKYIQRDSMFQTGCNICYLPGQTFPTNKYRPFSFSTYPESPAASGIFQTPYFSPTQYPTKTMLQTDLGIASNDEQYQSADLFDRKHPPGYTCTIEWNYRAQNWYTGDVTGSIVTNVVFNDFSRYTDFYVIPQKALPGYLVDAPFVWESIYFKPRACAYIQFFTRSQYNYLKNFNVDPKVVKAAYTLSGQYSNNIDFMVVRCGATQMYTQAGVPYNGDDFLGQPYSQLCNSDVAYYKVYPIQDGGNFYQVRVNASPTRKNDFGTYGNNFLPGVVSYPYAPAFMEIREIYQYSPDYNFMGPRNTVTLSSEIPIYFIAKPSDVRYIYNTYVTTTLPNCFTCMKTLVPIYYWDPLIYATSTWVADFDPRIIDNVQLLQNGVYINLTSAPLDLLTHQVTYIESRNNTAASPSRVASQSVTWAINSCLVIGAAGYEAVPCEANLYNYVCLYDYTKYTVLPGYMCDKCGDGSRSGGTPDPGGTCYESFPLANATANQVAHQIKTSYLQGTLDFYAASFNMPTDVIDFFNRSIIWGFEIAYNFFAQDISNRPGQSSRGVQELLNWCDMSVTNNWPIDCGIQSNPITNQPERYCVSNTEFCNLQATIAENAVIQQSEVPPIFSNSDSTIATSDPTCGYTVRLQAYAKIDKYGGIQDELATYFTILALTPDLIQFQFNSTIQARWYNAGKSTTKYVFEYNLTSTVNGRYILQGCESCISPIMEVFIHPLNVFYTFPTKILAVNVSLVNDVSTNYIVSFSVTPEDTGIENINGEIFPVTAFKGLGYRFYNVDKGASITLYNPVITNPQSIALCLNKPKVTYYEPKTRILSTAPLRQCILKEADLLLYPGSNIGECGCDLSTAGRDCKCYAVVSKFGKSLCGGFGDSNVGVIASNGQFVTTRSGTEAGCYVIGDVSDCKVVEIGRAAYTLQVNNAPWDYPSVFIESAPQAGEGLFINPTNTLNLQLTYEELQDECVLEASYLPYYFTSDELNQLIRKNAGLGPVLIAVSNFTYENKLPWDNTVDGSYFVNGQTPEVIATENSLDCSVPGLVLACEALNFNNYAYNGTTGVTDGNTLIKFTYTLPLSIQYSSSLALDIVVYVFLPSLTTNFISCVGGGICEDRIPKGNNAQFNCRCPTRTIQFLAGTYAEIQIFDKNDLLRNTIYKYN